jgi:hypothetical protein
VFQAIGTIARVVKLVHKSFRLVNVFGVAQYVTIGNIRAGTTFTPKNVLVFRSSNLCSSSIRS